MKSGGPGRKGNCREGELPACVLREVGILDTETYQTVARVGEIAEGRGIPVEVGDRVIAVFLDEGVYYAIDDMCPHKGAPLCDGIVCDKSVTCTWHGWRFSFTDGRWIDNPRIRVATYPVRVVGDEIQVAVD
jgi:nitrite reductase (NADH) small subunit/3-phenylpropionate/trans-cinnamate dioxygenase ferredoxin subunit